MPKVVGKDEKYIFKATCTECASILEFTGSELHRGVRLNWYLKCPVCAYRIVDPMARITI